MLFPSTHSQKLTASAFRTQASSSIRANTRIYMVYSACILILLSFALSLSIPINRTQAAKNTASRNLSSPSPVSQSTASSAQDDSQRLAEGASREAYGRLPIGFEANQGQTDSQVKFLARGSGYNLFLTPSEAVLVLSKSTARAKRLPITSETATPTDEKRINAVLRMRFLGGNSQSQLIGVGRQQGSSNYFVGADGQNWHTSAPNYNQVKYEDVYPGIDVVYYGNQRQLEYDFIVAPGADTNLIKLGFEGAKGLSVDRKGDLVLRTGGGIIRQHRPLAYQEVKGSRQTVDCRYVLEGKNEVRLKVGRYDVNSPLVIDPTVVYSTFLGSTFYDSLGVAVDSTGNAYVVGQTTSPVFPTTGGAFRPNYIGGTTDVFVTKLEASGSTLGYSTFLGGSAREWGRSIAVDSDGNAYVTGFTESGDFPTTAGAFQRGFGGGADVFVTKLNPTGTALVYSTFLGGGSRDDGYGIAVDDSGNAYIGGETASANFPTAHAVQGSNRSYPYTFDAFVAKLNPEGSALVYSTYLGGDATYQGGFNHGDDHVKSIALDASGSAYVVGETWSTDFPTTSGALQQSIGPYAHVFVTKLSPAGSALAYSTYLGGNSYDFARSIAVSKAGNAFITGATISTNLPVTGGAYQRSLIGGSDAYVMKLNTDGSAVDYFTYLGGSEFEWGRSIGVDDSGNAFIVGQTSSPNFPTTPDAYQGTLSSNNVYVTKLDATGSNILYSTFLGAAWDNTYGIAIDPAGNAYVAGETNSPSFPTTENAYRTDFSGSQACVFVTKIGNDPPLIFVPGIGGSYLYDRTSGTELWPGFLTNHNPLTLDPAENPNPNIIATDAIRKYQKSPLGVTVTLATVYEPLLKKLRDSGYREYQVNGDPDRRTSNKCDLSQKDNHPNLFVFAYDWRLSNEKNAEALKDYIGCVKQFYPDSKVNILAHSMGGLVARRYIIDNHDDHNVNNFITIASPWLGAPKGIYALETGDAKFNVLQIWQSTLKRLIEFFPGMHELLPSQSYYDLRGRPMREIGDFNQNGVPDETYTIPQIVDLLDKRHQRSTPGTTGAVFHNTYGQDDWRSTGFGIEYNHIYGEQNHNQTIGQVVAQTVLSCGIDPLIEGIICVPEDQFKPLMIKGDGTVPLRSASRLDDSGTFGLNAPKTHRWSFSSYDDDTDSYAEHTGLTQTDVVQQLVLYILGRASKPSSLEAIGRLQPKAYGPRKSLMASTRRTDAESGAVENVVSLGLGKAAHGRSAKSRLAALQESGDPSKEPSYYLMISGVGFVSVTDDKGNTNTQIDDTFALPVPNVTYDLVGDHSVFLSMPTDKTYTLTFQTGANPISLELLKGVDNANPTEAARYRDAKLPAGVTVMLKTSPDGISAVTYDKDGDGNFETTVTPTAVLPGNAAADIDPPSIEFSTATNQNVRQVAITATDIGSGVKSLYYSLDGRSFRPYTSPISIASGQAPTIYAFADDNAANRSGLANYTVPPDSNNKLTPTVSVNEGTFTYDGLPHAATGSVIGAGGEDLGMPEFTYNGSTELPVNAGVYTVVATFAGNDHYTAGVSDSVTIRIIKATPTIQWNQPADITYGTPLGAAELNATAKLNEANVPGTFTYSIAAGTLLNAGNNQSLTVNFAPTDTTNFAPASASVSINVLKAVPIMNITGGTFTYDGKEHPAVGAVTGVNNEDLGASTITYNDSSTPPVNAGSYTVVGTYPGSTNYSAVSNSTARITINRATPVINWSNPADITFGTPLGAIQLNAIATFDGATLPGAFTYTPAAGTLLSAGSGQKLSLTFNAADGNNFNTAKADVVINVLKATPSFNDLSSPNIITGTSSTLISGKLLFGSLIPTGSVSVVLNGVNQTAQIQSDGSFSTSFSTGPLLPTTSPYQITYSYGGDGNFNGVVGNGSFTVAYNVCPLYDQTRTYLSGSTIPIKLQLCDAGGKNLSSQSILVKALRIVQTSTISFGQLEDAGNSNPDDNFRYDATLEKTGGYIFNLKTTGLTTGVYTLSFKAGNDPTLHAVPFQIR